ncbi:hypothetical protein BUE76_19470 [Cnuella takakiae]|nr:hypothetical protein BUE76_19470 [Cnuella takakiae]
MLFIAASIAACKQSPQEQAQMPSRTYHYAQPDAASIREKHSVYVPVYSHLYGEDGTMTVGMTTTLSIRNISFRDSFYVTGVVYYGSQGELLQRYLQKPLVLRPMHSVEFVVERREEKGGAGANFVVDWAATAPMANAPMIQAVTSIISTGFSFVSEGREINNNSLSLPAQQVINAIR